MISISSYIRDSSHDLVPVSHFTGDIDPTIDPMYDIEGSVELVINENILIRKGQWTHQIDFLWTGLIQASRNAKNKKDFICFFTGIGYIGFSVSSDNNDKIIVSVSDTRDGQGNQESIDRNVLVHAILVASKFYHERIIKIFPDNQVVYQPKLNIVESMLNPKSEESR